MGLLKRLREKRFQNKKSDSKFYRREMASRIDGKHIRYVTERKDNVEIVIGKDGGINVKGDELLVHASARVLFRCKIDDLKAWELLSKEGVTLTGPDIENGGEERTIIAFYVYHR